MRNLFIIILFTSLGFSNQILSQTDCLPKQLGCTAVQSFTATVNIPAYPNCPITLTYDLRICQGVSQISNVVIQSIPYGNPGCNQLLTDVLSFVFGGNQVQLQVFLTTFWSAVETAIADQLWQLTLQGAIANGTASILKCNGGFTTFTASFYRGTCVSFCFGQSKEGGLKISQASCGTTCCKKSKNYCLNDQGQVQITESVQQLNPGECFTQSLPSCGEGNLFQSPCFDLCQP